MFSRGFCLGFFVISDTAPCSSCKMQHTASLATKYRGRKNSYLDISIPDIRGLGRAPQFGRRMFSTPKQKTGCCLFDMQQAT